MPHARPVLLGAHVDEFGVDVEPEAAEAGGLEAEEEREGERVLRRVALDSRERVAGLDEGAQHRLVWPAAGHASRLVDVRVPVRVSAASVMYEHI